MEEFIQFSAKTKNEAITKACIELGVSSDQLEIEVVSEGSSGFFGIGSKPAIIKARKINTVSEEDEIQEIVDTVKVDAIKEEQTKKPAKTFVKAEKPAPKSEPVKAAVKEAKEPKPFKETKEKQSRQPKEKTFKERPVKEKPAKEKMPKEPREEKPKQSKPVEIITDPAEIKEVEERAIVFLRDVFASMNLGEVEITSKYNTNDGCLEVAFEGEDMGILIGKRGQTLDSLQYLVSLIVKKALNMAKSMEIPVIGLVENYSYVICPDCGKEFKIFGESGLDKLAEELDLPILGRMPIDPKLAELASGEFAKANNEYLAAAESLLIALEG